jgi:hypothetical protein
VAVAGNPQLIAELQELNINFRTSTSFDRRLRLLSRTTNGHSDEKAKRAIEEYVATLHHDARGAALDERVRRQKGLGLVGFDLSCDQLH